MDRRRIQKLLELRQKALDTKVSELGAARQAVETAIAAVTRAASALERAADERKQMNRAGADWQTWVTTQDWMSLKAREFSAAQQQKSHCERLAERALAAVHKARSEALRIEALLARVDSEARQKELRKERRAEDEFQANQSAREEISR
ncbi:MAG: hypothetical protein SFV15_23110 [Polyangiaceae bacterium]|nr:hypothetical protein [Polyangiaceae bacterium]